MKEAQGQLRRDFKHRTEGLAAVPLGRAVDIPRPVSEQDVMRT
jgi:hypothetical protein